MPHARTSTALLLGLLPLAACGPSDAPATPDAATEPAADEPAGAPWFEEVARAAGLDFEHVSGADGRFLMPEIMTTGAALVDVDDDGDLDAYLLQAGGVDQPRAERPTNRLFLNDGGGRFTDATEGSGADDRGYGMGVATGDYDGDGDQDLYVSNLDRNTLLRNDGGKRFVDVAEKAGVVGKDWSYTAAAADFDQAYLQALGACAAESDIVASLEAFGEAQANLTPEEIAQTNFGLPVFKECLEDLGWTVGDLVPDERGALGFDGGVGGGLQPPDGTDDLDFDDVGQCRQEAETHVAENYRPEDADG